MKKLIFLMKKSKISTFFRFQNFQNHFSPRKNFLFRFGFFSVLEIISTSTLYAQISLKVIINLIYQGFHKKVCSYELFIGEPFIYDSSRRGKLTPPTPKQKNFQLVEFQGVRGSWVCMTS